MISFEGQRIVVTGAGGGIGQAIVARLGALGARIVACDLDGAALDSPFISEIHHFDLCDPMATQRAATAILAAGPPAVVISNAGRTSEETLEETTQAGLVAEMDANFTGAARFCQALLPGMRKSTGDRAFVFVASVNALAHHGNPAYSAAKAALLAWMRAIAVEEGRHGIRANAVVPASVRTNAWVHRLAGDPGVMDRVSALYPLGRIVTVEEVANAVAFLASPAASGITGTTLAVDAGLMAGNLPFLQAIRPA